MKRLLAVAAVVLVAGGAPTYVLGGRSETGSRTLTVGVGDVVRVTGAGNVGCRVVVHEGLETLDCRRAGTLKGTYGALLNKRELLVVRFLGSKSAKVVVEARHGSRNIRLCS